MGLTEKQQLHRTLTGKQQLHRTLTGKQQPHRIMMINQQIPTNPEAVISTQVKVALVCPSQTVTKLSRNIAFSRSHVSCVGFITHLIRQHVV